jgi:hypothetical protein
MKDRKALRNDLFSLAGVQVVLNNTLVGEMARPEGWDSEHASLRRKNVFITS